MVKGQSLIVALDLPSLYQAEAMVDRLFPTVDFFKIGLELLYCGGIALAKSLLKNNCRVFIDTKLYDIPRTIEASVKALSDIGVDFITVHGERQIVESAVTACKEYPTKILAVTVLTSQSHDDISNSGCKLSVDDLVELRAKQSIISGADGLICSPLELLRLRALFKKSILVSPGIRLSTSCDFHDQKRIASPKKAWTDGANYIVVGRPIVNARDPLLIAKSILLDLPELS